MKSEDAIRQMTEGLAAQPVKRVELWTGRYGLPTGLGRHRHAMRRLTVAVHRHGRHDWARLRQVLTRLSGRDRI